MSDFLLATGPFNKQQLHRAWTSLCSEPNVVPKFQTEGKWGALLASNNQYPGFAPIETEENIVVVIGGPIVALTENPLPSKIEPDAKFSNAILDAWRERHIVRWDQDLSGPFAILIVDKQSNTVHVVTDILSFIPVFYSVPKQRPTSIILGTRVDDVARLASRQSDYDLVSAVDFVRRANICFPYTTYQDVWEVPPASSLSHDGSGNECMVESYWQPKEEYPFRSIHDAADVLEKEFTAHIGRILDGKTKCACFLSGGEDSRAVASAVARRLTPDCFIFVEGPHLEARVAENVARRLGCQLRVGTRKLDHYVRQFEAGVSLIGSQAEVLNLHTNAFVSQFGLDTYDAVFGGFWSDTLLKGLFCPLITTQLGDLEVRPARLAHRSSGVSLEIPPETPFDFEKLRAQKERRIRYFEHVREFRPQTAVEWQRFWPITNMRETACFQGDRRLFRSYEPFAAANVVKLARAVPIEWKLNHRLFRLGMRRVFGSVGWIPHASGRVPRAPFFLNVPLEFGVRLWRFVQRRLGRQDASNTGPWPIWERVVQTPAFTQLVAKHEGQFDAVRGIFRLEYGELMETHKLSLLEKFAVLQILTSISQNRQVSIH